MVDWTGFRHRHYETTYTEKYPNGNSCKTHGTFQCLDQKTRSILYRENGFRTDDYKYWDTKRQETVMSQNPNANTQVLTGEGKHYASDDTAFPYALTMFNFNSSLTTWGLSLEHSGQGVIGFCYGKNGTFDYPFGDTNIFYTGTYRPIGRIDWIFSVWNAGQLVQAVFRHPLPLAECTFKKWMSDRELQIEVELL